MNGNFGPLEQNPRRRPGPAQRRTNKLLREEIEDLTRKNGNVCEERDALKGEVERLRDAALIAAKESTDGD